MQGNARSEVHVRIPVPMALHKQLRLRAFAQDMSMKDAVLAAIEAWVAPGEQEVRAQARGARQVLDLFDRGNREKDLPGARKNVLALLEELEGWRP
jgi:hypothetical protein